jgi:hypothetical protein
LIRIISCQQSVWIEPEVRLEVCDDKADNVFLECAFAGNADYLVTKNIRHFPPKEYANVKIVRIRRFLQALEEIEMDRKEKLPRHNLLSNRKVPQMSSGLCKPPGQDEHQGGRERWIWTAYCSVPNIFGH